MLCNQGISGSFVRRTLDSMSDLTQPDAESLRLELQEALVTIRQQYSLLTQIFGIIATADSLLLAYGFTQRASGVLLVASFTPIIMLISFFEIVNNTVPMVYVAVTLEQRLNLRDAPLAAMYVRTYLRDIFATMGERTSMTDSAIRESILGLTRRSWLNSRPAYILYIVFIVQIGLFFISLLTYHYRFM